MAEVIEKSVLLNNRTLRKFLLVFVFTILAATLTMVYLATRSISSNDSHLLMVSQKISKALIMRGLDQFERKFYSKTYAPTPLDSHDFEYADLSHSYFENIRNDKRLAHLYSKPPNIHSYYVDFSDAISMREYLRDLFPHGQPSGNFLNANVLEMINAAE